MKEMAESQNIARVSIFRVDLTEWQLRCWMAKGWGVGERLLGVKVQEDQVSKQEKLVEEGGGCIENNSL